MIGHECISSSWRGQWEWGGNKERKMIDRYIDIVFERGG
jgi:hypothetical protein